MSKRPKAACLTTPFAPGPWPLTRALSPYLALLSFRSYLGLNGSTSHEGTQS